MRELDRNPSTTPPLRLRCAVIGAGRLGHALTVALRQAGLEVAGPLGRGADPEADAALLCVPDAEIEAAAAALTPDRARFVGHCSGATTLAPLAGHAAFSLHPLMTVPAGEAAPFAGAGCAVAGSSAAALDVAETLAATLQMRPVEVADGDRAAYHAAASIAANFLVTLEGAAERLAATAGVPRDLLVPLARAALENWAATGAEHALTGPVARGDEATIARQRAAVEERAPDLLDTFDALVAASRVLRSDPPTPRHQRMRTIRTVAEMQEHSRGARAAGRTIGLVPTMGAFHGGHESLIRAARAGSDELIVSLFVNPAQFNDARDLEAYPRDERRDAAIAERLGVDVLFAPPAEAVYPAGFATTVSVRGLSDVLEGAKRGPGHFAGVSTVVAKLFNMVAPDVAYFGQKDAQQVAVIRRMARDLDLPVEIEVLPTIREPDGLAMSSRNVRLDPGERARAVALSCALDAVREAIDAGDPEPRAAGLRALDAHRVVPEYLALVDPATFQEPTHDLVLVAVAASIGDTRLIDNVLIKRAATPDRRGADPKGAVRVLPTP